MGSISLKFENLSIELFKTKLNFEGFQSTSSVDILQNLYVQPHYDDPKFTDEPQNCDLVMDLILNVNAPDENNSIYQKNLLNFYATVSINNSIPIKIHDDVNKTMQKLYDYIDSYSIDNNIRNQSGLLFKCPRFLLSTASLENILKPDTY